MVFLFQIGAEKVASTTTATESGQRLYSRGMLGHTLLVAVAKNVVQKPDVKRVGENQKGKTDQYAKTMGKYDVTVSLPAGMGLENALKNATVGMIIIDREEKSLRSMMPGCNLTAKGAEAIPSPMAAYTQLEMSKTGASKEQLEKINEDMLKEGTGKLSDALGYLDKQMGEFGPRK